MIRLSSLVFGQIVWKIKSDVEVMKVKVQYIALPLSNSLKPWFISS